MSENRVQRDVILLVAVFFFLTPMMLSDPAYGLAGKCDNCDDSNPCTRDYCGDNGCVHEKLSCYYDGKASQGTVESSENSNRTAQIGPRNQGNAGMQGIAGASGTPGGSETTGSAGASGGSETSGSAGASGGSETPESAGASGGSETSGSNADQQETGTTGDAGAPVYGISSGLVGSGYNGAGSGNNGIASDGNASEETGAEENEPSNSSSSDSGEPGLLMAANSPMTEIDELADESSNPEEENSSHMEDAQEFTNDSNETEIEAQASLSASRRHCDDGIACTDDTWDGKECVHTLKDCDDGNPCTTDSCEDGQCIHVKKDCDDHNDSTIDYCLDGVCINSPKICDDGIECTIDTWNGAACVHTEGNCSDGNPCTIDTCESGKCVHTQKDCDDHNLCTIDTCENGNCINKKMDCDDHNPCTIDTCKDGKCVRTKRDCDDHNPCTLDSCDKNGECVHIWRVCDDGDPCTIDSCDSELGCIHVPVVCGEGKTCVDGTCQYAASNYAQPGTYDIAKGSIIVLPWGKQVVALESVKMENGVAYSSGSPLSFVRQITDSQISLLDSTGTSLSERSEMIGITWQNSPLTMTLFKPDGSTFSGTESSQDVIHMTGSNYDYYFLRSPEKGNWYVKVDASGAGSSGEKYSLISGQVKGGAT